MVIIEAKTGYSDTPQRVLILHSAFTAFYFLKGVSFFVTIEDIVTLPNKTKVQVNVSNDSLSQWDGAARRCKDNKANDKEFLFFINRSIISDDLRNRKKEEKEKEQAERKKEVQDGLPIPTFDFLFPFFNALTEEEIELEKSKQLNSFIASLGSEVVDIEEFENNCNKVYLIIVE